MAELASEHFRVCVIGAGPTGLTTLKNLADAGIDNVICHEAQDVTGGIWVFSGDPERPSVYESAHTISSKRLSQFPDFPMPEDYPDYPSNAQILAYMRAYEAHFDLGRHIRLNSRVETVTRQADGCWKIEAVRDGQSHVHTAEQLIVCSGHHREPVLPDLPGGFDGEQIHSVRYKKAQDFAGKRVLVVGGGNSACDIAVALAPVTSHVSLSLRSPQVIVPKLVGGRPVDVQFRKLHKPMFRWARDWLVERIIKFTVGPYARYGLPEPDFPFLSRHPTLNTDVLERIRHGMITVRPAISSAEGSKIGFSDGTSGEFDTIIWATGFRLGVPFLSQVCDDWDDVTQVPLYLRMLPESEPNLYFIGLVQPVGCIWVVADLQARLAAAEISGAWKRPPDIGTRIARALRRDAGRYKASRRHAIQIDIHEYTAEISAELAKVSRQPAAGP
ncbi:flavin-containing monooxygenase [Hoeflea sp.]|uniref:flavin-containing monooxygenase n=1 Tax=Hoeflea sp. TaxID=1940281 RepID=UPI003B52A5C6